MNFVGEIEGEKMTIDINYMLENQKLAGTWKVANANLQTSTSYDLSPLWFDWDSKVKVNAGKIYGIIPNLANLWKSDRYLSERSH